MDFENSNSGTFNVNKFDYLTQFLSDTSYNTTNADIEHDDGYLQEFNALNAFASVWKENYLQGPEDDDAFPTQYFYRFGNLFLGSTEEFGNAFGGFANIVNMTQLQGWTNQGFSNSALINEGFIRLGYNTKYYNKRISCYPQYGFAKRVDFNNGTTWNDGSYVGNMVNGEAFDINERQKTKYLPFENLQSTSGGSPFAVPRDQIDTAGGEFYEARITFGKVIDVSESVSSLDLGTERAYVNRSTFGSFNVNTGLYYRFNMQNTQLPAYAADEMNFYRAHHVTAKIIKHCL